MALFAFLLKRAVMRIRVASGASCEIHIFEAGRAAGGIRLVAGFAFHLLMQTGERITRFRVIELLCRFPIDHVVATFAILAKLPFVHVLVARDTLL